jgi:hypothetical protein
MQINLLRAAYFVAAFFQIIPNGPGRDVELPCNFRCSEIRGAVQLFKFKLPNSLESSLRAVTTSAKVLLNA